jgi:hypothetical protein
LRIAAAASFAANNAFSDVGAGTNSRPLTGMAFGGFGAAASCGFIDV